MNGCNEAPCNLRTTLLVLMVDMPFSPTNRPLNWSRSQPFNDFNEKELGDGLLMRIVESM